MKFYKTRQRTMDIKAIALCLSLLLGALFARAQSPFDSLFREASLSGGECDLMHAKNCDTCLAFALQALQIAESDSSSVSPVQRISVYKFIGDIYHRQRKFDTAIQYLNRGILFADSTIGRNNKEVSDCFFFLGLIEEYKQAYAKALQYHQMCLEIREGLAPPMFAELAKSHQRLGACFGNIKDREREKQHLDYAKWICEQHPEVSPDIYNSIAIDRVTSATNAGEFDEAMRLVEGLLANPALSTKQKSDAWSRLANISHNQGKLELASKDYQRQIEILEHDKGPYDSWLTWPYSDLGQLLEQQGDTAGALRCYHRVVEISHHNFAYHYSIGTSEYRIADLHFRYKEFDAALREVQQALISLNPGFRDSSISANPPLDNSINYNYFRRALWLKGRILTELVHKTDNGLFYLQQALMTYRHCLDLIDRFRNNLPTIGARSSDLAEFRHIYEEVISIELEAASQNGGAALESAFITNEKSKAFLLYAGIRENQAIRFSEIPEEIRKKELNFKQQINQLENQRNEAVSKSKNDSDSLTMDLTGKLLDARHTYEVLVKSIEVQYPEYYRLKHDLQVESVENVQQSLQPDQALLEYFVGDSSIFIFLIKKNDYRVIEVKKDFPLEGWVKQLRYGIYGYHTADPKMKTDHLRDSCVNEYIESATALYQKLLTPVDSLLPRRVIIVPDGVLGYIPFEALLTGRPKWAGRFHEYPYFGRQDGKEHSISYCYSATLLREMTTRQHRKAPDKSFLAYAPYYDGDTTLLASRYIDPSNPANRLPPLKYATEEVEALHDIMGGKAVIGRSARKDSLIQEAGQYRIVHLSTHGKANDKVGDYSFLAFSEVKDSVDNEWLYVRDIYNLSLNADMVVLSACETGIGELKRGEGIISLARAFAYAGAKSIVTTLWSVDDAKTKDLMIFFYRNLKQGMTKDEALTKARNDYFEKYKSGAAHPFFWAGFVGIGDMGAIR